MILIAKKTDFSPVLFIVLQRCSCLITFSNLKHILSSFWFIHLILLQLLFQGTFLLLSLSLFLSPIFCIDASRRVTYKINISQFYYVPFVSFFVSHVSTSLLCSIIYPHMSTYAVKHRELILIVSQMCGLDNVVSVALMVLLLLYKHSFFGTKRQMSRSFHKITISFY